MLLDRLIHPAEQLEAGWHLPLNHAQPDDRIGAGRSIAVTPASAQRHSSRATVGAGLLALHQLCNR